MRNIIIYAKKAHGKGISKKSKKCTFVKRLHCTRDRLHFFCNVFVNDFNSVKRLASAIIL